MPENRSHENCDVGTEASADPGVLVDLSAMPMSEFRERVKRWANSFDPEFRSVAYALGNAVDRVTWISNYKQETLQRKMQEALDAQGNGHVAMGISTLRSRLRTMREAGVIETVRQPRKVVTNFAGVQHFQALANETWVNFTKVIASGEVVNHGFIRDLSDGPIDRDQVSNSGTSANTSADGIQYRSSICQSSKEVVPADGTPSATRGEAPRTPLSCTSDQCQAALEEVVPGWWTEALNEMARALERRYGTRVRRTTLRAKLLHLIDYFEHEADLAESVLDFIAARHDSMSAGNEVRYIIGTFADWVTENCVTIEEWNSPEYQARMLFQKAQEARLITPYGSHFQSVEPDGSAVRRSETEWLERLTNREQADSMRALLEAKGA